MNDDNGLPEPELAQVPNPFIERVATEEKKESQHALVPFDIEKGFQPVDSEQMRRLAQWLIKSKIVPSSFKDEAQIIACWGQAGELGLRPMQALRSLYVVQGNIGMRANGKLALVEGRGLLADTPKVEYSGEGDEMSCRVTVRRKGRKSSHSVSFSIRQAKLAGLLQRGGAWLTYPERMLYARALSFALDDVFPDVLRGMKSVEELQDYPAEANNK